MAIVSHQKRISTDSETGAYLSHVSGSVKVALFAHVKAIKALQAALRTYSADEVLDALVDAGLPAVLAVSAIRAARQKGAA